jgi:hypothetical protein
LEADDGGVAGRQGIEWRGLDHAGSGKATILGDPRASCRRGNAASRFSMDPGEPIFLT